MTWLARFFARRRLRQELAEEIRGHLDEKVEDLIEAGMSRAEAILAARRAFGNVTLAAERGFEVWGWASIETWWVDAKYASRQLWKQPAFTLAAALSIALGVGMSTTVVAAVDAVLLHPFPYRDSDRIVHLHVFDHGGFLFDLPLSSQQFDRFRRSLPVEEAMAMDVESMTAGDGEMPASVNAGFLTPNAFGFLGVPPLLGRVFTSEDAASPSDPRNVVVLSFGYWQKRYGGQRQIVGERLTLDHRSYTIIGVMPKRFAWWSSDVYLPLKRSSDPDRLATVFARLRRGLNDDEAQAALQSLVEELARERPDRLPPQFELRLLHMSEIAGGRLSTPLLTIGVAAGLLLIIGCANLSILLLARGTAKTHELAIRAAIGAGRARIVRQLLTESMLISVGGGLGGALLASLTVGLIPSLLPEGTFPAETSLEMSLPVVLVATGLAVTSGVVAGLFPALRCSGRHRPAIARAGWPGPRGDRSTAGSQSLLIAGQVALTVVLLAGAGATSMAFNRALHARLDYDPKHLASIRVDLRDGTYPEWGRRITYFEDVREAVAGTPGVVSAAVSLIDLPPSAPFHTSRVEHGSASRAEPAFVSEVGAEYFSTLGIPLLHGRAWTALETRRAARVAVINRSMAMRDWPDGGPIGQVVGLPDLVPATSWAVASPDSRGWLRIVGVVADTPNNGLTGPAMPTIYVPYTLVVGDSFRLVTRTVGDPIQVVRAVARQIYAVDPDQPITEVHTGAERLEAEGWAPGRFMAALFGVFAAVAILLATAGLYSLVSYVISQQQHDFALRIALGARPIQVVRMVMASAMNPMTAGLALGLTVTAALDGMLSRWLQVTVRDPFVLVPIVGILVGVTFCASLVPACRAGSVDPMTMLRAE